MILSDRDLKERVGKDIIVRPMEPDQIGPSSIDLSLGNKWRIFKQLTKTHIDPSKDKDTDEFTEVVTADEFVIHPGEFVLGTTKEFIQVPVDLVGRLEGRSSWGRLGIVIHSTAGFVNPGFNGTLTLEMTNLGKMPVLLKSGMRICQIIFEKLNSPVETPYDKRESSKYAGQNGPGASKIFTENKK
jgi:dCTP deaminase